MMCFVLIGRVIKLSPRHIDPYVFIRRVGPALYRLELPLELAWVHDLFYVSMRRKYVPDPSHVLQVQLVDLREDLSYKEERYKSLTGKSKCQETRPSLWRHHEVGEAILETEDKMKSK